MHEIMSMLDDNNSQSLDFKEFVRMITSPMVTGQNLGHFKNHFKAQMVS